MEGYRLVQVYDSPISEGKHLFAIIKTEELGQEYGGFSRIKGMHDSAYWNCTIERLRKNNTFILEF